MKKQDAFDETNINTSENQENIITSSNFENFNRKLSTLNSSDNNNNNESPSDVDNEQNEPEERNRKDSINSEGVSRKGSLDPNEYHNQPRKNSSSPSVFNEEYKGGKDDETDEQSEEENSVEEKFVPSESGKHLISKRVSLAESKNKFHQYILKDSKSPESDPKSSLPNDKSQNKLNLYSSNNHKLTQYSSNNDYIDPTIKSLRRDSTVSITPFNSETEQTLSEVEAMQRKYSAVIRPSNLNVSRLNTNNENKVEQTKKKEMSNKNESKEYNIKIILNPGNSTYSIDHPEGENVKVFNINTEGNRTDVAVSFMGDSGLDLH